MAIAYDTSASGQADTQVSLTFSHTMSSSSGGFLAVFINLDQTLTDGVITVYYGGQAMTRGGAVSSGSAPSSSSYAYVYYLFAPPTGANNLVITCNTTYIINALSVSYTGVRPTTIDGTVSNNLDAVSSYTGTLVTTHDQSWGLVFIVTGIRTVTPGTNLTQRAIFTSSYGTNQHMFAGDSAAAISPAGSYDQSATFSGNVSHGEWIQIGIPLPLTTQTLTETVTDTDILTKKTSRSLTETLTDTDTVAKLKVMVKTLTTEAITNTATKIITRLATLSEAFTSIDRFVFQIVRTLTESLTMTSSITDKLVKVVTMVEGLTLVITFRKLLNGIATIWSQLSKSVTSWIGSNKSSTSWTTSNKSSTTWTPKDKS